MAPAGKYKIENIVATASLGTELDLIALSISLDESKYRREQFPGLICHLKELKTTALLFHSGKVVLTGAKSLKIMRMTFEKVIKMLDAAGVPIKTESNIEVRNIVASATLGQNINLNAIAIALGLEKTEYEPEQFPGLLYRLDAPKVVLLLFASGKFICVGARKTKDIEDAIIRITEELRSAGQLG